MAPLRVMLLYAFLVTSLATDYYVDFVGGSDSNNGTSTATPWKHAPSDSNATGTAASTTLNAGDNINFKGGVSYLGSLTPTRNGSAGSPITWQTASGWGTGRAVIDGRVSAGVTNTVGFDVNGKYNTLNGLEIRFFQNFIVRLYDSTPNNFTMTNCLVHDVVSPSFARCLTINNCSDTLIVSNKFYTSALKLANGNNLITNVVLWGNEFYDAHDDAINLWAYGYTAIVGNYIHDLIEDGNHSDAMQLLGFPPGSPMVIANNLIVSSNTQAIFLEPYNATTDGSSGIVAGQVYQVVTNSLSPGNAATKFVYNSTTNSPGTKFTGVGGQTSGTWQGTAALIKEYFPAGKYYIFGNVVKGISATAGAAGYAISGLDTYTEVQEGWVFNNTWDHAIAWVASGRDVWCSTTNFYSFNNITFEGSRGLDFTITGAQTTERNDLLTSTDMYNAFTNAALANVMFSRPGDNSFHTFAEFQAAKPGHEVNSLVGPVAFTDRANLDYTLVSAAAIGTGTNLTGKVDLTFLPAAWRPDPTKDRAGVQRDASARWSIGAYEYSASSSGGATFYTKPRRRR